MGYLKVKKVRDTEYYYYRETARIDGTPTHIKEQYLGNAKQILNRMLHYHDELQKNVISSKLISFGAPAFFYDVANKIELFPLIEDHLSKGQIDQHLGSLLFALALYALDPASGYLSLPTWYQSTTLPSLLGNDLFESEPAITLTTLQINKMNKELKSYIRPLKKVILHKLPRLHQDLIYVVADLCSGNPELLSNDKNSIFSFFNNYMLFLYLSGIHLLRVNEINCKEEYIYQNLMSLQMIVTYVKDKQTTKGIISFTNPSDSAAAIDRCFQLRAQYTHLPK